MKHFAWCAAYAAVRAGEAKSLICVVFSPSKGLDLCRFDPHKGLDLCETQGKYKESRIDYKKCCIDAAYKLFAI